VEFVAAVDALLRIGKAPKSFPQWVSTEQAPAVIRKASVEGFPYVTRAGASFFTTGRCGFYPVSLGPLSGASKADAASDAQLPGQQHDACIPRTR